MGGSTTYMYICMCKRGNGQAVTGQTRVEAGPMVRALATVHVVKQSTTKVSTR